MVFIIILFFSIFPELQFGRSLCAFSCILLFDSFHCFLSWLVPFDLAHYNSLAGWLAGYSISNFCFVLHSFFVNGPAR